MTKTEHRYSWRTGFKASVSDPRVWIGSVVTIVAIGLLLSAPDSNADLRGIYVASSIALAVAGFPQAITALTEHARDEARRADDERKDLDESRRVALMALSAGTPGERYAEVVATVVNALTYHSHVLTPTEARELLQKFQMGQYQPAHPQIQEWVDELCTKRGDQPMYRSR